MRTIVVIFILFSTLANAQSDSTGMKGHHLYFKSGLPETALRLLVNQSIHLDGQVHYRLKDAWYLTSYYGYTTFSQVATGNTTDQATVAQDIDRQGKAYNKTYLGVRFHPYFDHNWTALNYFFLEGGVHYQNYKENASITEYYSVSKEIVNQYEYTLDLQRYGPYINIGFSRFFADYLEKLYDRKGPKVSFSPELSLGFNYNFYSINQEAVAIYEGSGTYKPYASRPFRLILNASVGIGLFK